MKPEAKTKKQRKQLAAAGGARVTFVEAKSAGAASVSAGSGSAAAGAGAGAGAGVSAGGEQLALLADSWKKFTCDDCARTLNGPSEWDAHLRSKQHRKRRAAIVKNKDNPRWPGRPGAGAAAPAAGAMV